MKGQRHLVSAIAAALLLAAIGAAPASAGTKPFTLNIAPPTVQAHQQVTFTATFAVPSSAQQQLGSADLSLPAGFTVVSAAAPSPAGAQVVAGKVQLRNLNVPPGGSIAVSVVAQAPCTTGTSSWSVRAKQSNDFNGPPGNDLNLDAAHSALSTTVTGGCAVAVRFVTQPTAAGVGQVISGTPYTPGGPPVSAEVIDADGNRVTDQPATIQVALGTGSGPGPLSGTTSVSTTLGLAQFSTLKIGSAGSYTLTASSPGLTSATSLPFQVDTSVSPCTEDLVCTGNLTAGGTKLGVTAFPDAANPDAGFLAASFNAGLALDCAGYTEVSPDTALVTVSSANRTKTVVLTIDKKLMNATSNNGASFLQMCFGSPQPFTTNSGTPATAQGTFDWNKDGIPDPVYVGLLPDCGATLPCVSKRNKTGSGDGVIEALLPAGLVDPAMRG
jgi:hypothetical protein